MNTARNTHAKQTAVDVRGVLKPGEIAFHAVSSPVREWGKQAVSKPLSTSHTHKGKRMNA